MFVGLKFFDAAVNGAFFVLIAQENVRQAARKLLGNFPERHHFARTGRKLDFEILAVIKIEFLQTLNQKIVNGKTRRDLASLNSRQTFRCGIRQARIGRSILCRRPSENTDSSCEHEKVRECRNRIKNSSSASI